MSEEKLRALLAEARVALQGVAAYDANPDVSWTLTKEDCRDALDRIDAALAEPVVECARCVTAREAFHEATRLRSGIQQARIKAENERDEARAEVERLGTALTQETRLSLHTQRQLDEARAEVARLEALSVERERVLDKLRWVSQEARAAVMLGYTGQNHETLRKALAQLTENKS